jgi:two-component sensor histidine kinase
LIISIVFFPIEPVDPNIAIPFGLILNELITNSFKHAFKNRVKGLIQISLIKHDDNKFHLIFKDDGIGLPTNYKELSTQSLGLELIDMLVLQLNGTVDIKNSDGVLFDIAFENTVDNLP